MPASNFNLRNVTPEVMLILKREASKKNVSVNSFIIQVLEQSLGVIRPAKKVVFHDLDHLAGTWTTKDKEKFDENIKAFEQIDEELW